MEHVLLKVTAPRRCFAACDFSFCHAAAAGGIDPRRSRALFVRVRARLSAGGSQLRPASPWHICCNATAHILLSVSARRRRRDCALGGRFRQRGRRRRVRHVRADTPARCFRAGSHGVLHCAAARDLSNIFVIDTFQIYHIRNDKTTSTASVYDPPPPAELRQRPRADVLQVMMRNLVTRGCPLYSLHAYPDLPAQKTRCVCCPRRPCDNVRCTCLHQEPVVLVRSHVELQLTAQQVPLCGVGACKRKRP